MNKSFDLLDFKHKHEILTRNQLKLIAIIAMIIDHIGYIFFPELLWLRWIGRLSLPIFIYLLVEGYTLTSNIKKYFERLLLFAFLSEVPFDLAFFNSPAYWGYQNIFFELSLSLLTVFLVEKKKQRSFAQGLIIFTLCVIAILIKADYHAYGILVTAMFYFCRGKLFPATLVILPIISYVFCEPYQMLSTLALPFIFFTQSPQKIVNQNRKGTLNTCFKAFSYGFYPFHLLVLYGIKMMIN